MRLLPAASRKIESCTWTRTSSSWASCKDAFALVDLPPGKELAITDELRGAAAADFHTPHDALDWSGCCALQS